MEPLLFWIRQTRTSVTGCVLCAPPCLKTLRTVWRTSWEPISSTTQRGRSERGRNYRCGMHHISPRNWENPVCQILIIKVCVFLCWHMSQLMRLWFLPHRRPGKAQASLHIRAILPEPSLFAHMKYGSRRRVRPKIRHLAPVDVCTWRIWRMNLQRMRWLIW